MTLAIVNFLIFILDFPVAFLEFHRFPSPPPPPHHHQFPLLSLLCPSGLELFLE
uniref:Uncharacterized protein n=1 Tax=Meloidogyne enterolobii TaxID=390850 RepID=A0A6V7UQM6_MELEN|nr:unnamed protein product [Meloidogyne enterolobii]